MKVLLFGIKLQLFLAKDKQRKAKLRDTVTADFVKKVFSLTYLEVHLGRLNALISINKSKLTYFRSKESQITRDGLTYNVGG